MAVPAIDYTGRDFDTIKAMLIARIRQKFSSTWKDFTESHFGMALLEIQAYAFDLLNYYLDVSANETFLPTAQDRQSIIFLGELVGYKLSPPTAASVTVKATIDSVYAEAIVIPAGTQIKSKKGVDFEVVEEQRIPAGSTSADVTMVQGLTRNETFTSTGDMFQKFRLAEASVIDGSIVVDVNSVEWDKTDSLVYGTEDSEIYEVSYDVDDYATLKFGDNNSGAIPPTSASIESEYRVGGGVIGNIPLNDIETTVSNTCYREGTAPTEYVDVLFNNSEHRGSGGNPRETIDHAKYWIPRWVSTNGRAVTQWDFTTLASLFNSPIYGAPAHARARLKQTIPELNTVMIAVWGRDESGNIELPSTGLKDAISEYFANDGENAVRLITTKVEVEDGKIVYVDINASVKAQTSYASSTVVASALEALNAMFSSSLVQPGRDVHISDVYAVLDGVVGVDYAIINLLTASYKIEDESIGTGTGVLATFSGTLLKTPVVEFSVVITDGTQTVTDDGSGKLTGDIDASGTNTIDYTTGSYNVTFAAAPALDADIVCTYRYVITYQRGEEETTTDGSSARIKGVLDYPPAVESTLAFSEGSQVAIDDGNGNITGDVAVSGNNTIDYDTGSYDFTLALVPSVGLTVRSTYVQRLASASEDIPIAEDQLAVKGRLTVAALA